MRLARHDWYEEEYKKWKSLPWRDPWFIGIIEQFTYHHANRNLATCRELALKIINVMSPPNGGQPTIATGVNYIIGLVMLLSRTLPCLSVTPCPQSLQLSRIEYCPS